MEWLVAGIALVLIYDFTNGFHDAADMIATAIASRKITPYRAIIIVTFFTFLGPFLGGITVASTIGELVHFNIKESLNINFIVLASVGTAVTYNLITWKLKLPSSSSNSLAGGLVGSSLFLLGSGSIRWGGEEFFNGQLTGFTKILIGVFISPPVGLLVGYFTIKFIIFFFQKFTKKIERYFNQFQHISIALLAFSHGINDAQKGMGIIGMLLLANGVTQSFSIPIWVIFICSSSITIGTMFGGWGIIKTVGFDIYKVKLIHSVANQLAAGFVISLSTLLGAPTSTTQIVTTALAGVGAGENPKRVKWSVLNSIIKGWVFNIPTSVFLGYTYSYILKFFFGS